TVALKTIAVGREAPDHDEVIERLKSEARAAGSLEHPNIITIYDVGHDGDRVYLSMQFVEGSTLAAMLDGKNLRPGQLTLLSYAEQICNAVAFAHERGVVHRDLKPSNLMLTPQGQIKVLDFGIAKKGDATLTRSGMVVGTPSYMAPEQATGKEVDHRSDIFSLGAVLYELFTGKKAFHADSITAVLYKVVHEAPDLPSAIDPTIPPGLEAAIRKALEKDPAQRFQNCVELRDTLRKEAVLLRTASAKVLAKPLLESGKHKRVAVKSRSRRALQVGAAACLLIVGATVVVWPQRSKMPRLMRAIGYVQQHLGKGRHNSAASTTASTTAAAPETHTTPVAGAGQTATSNPAAGPATDMAAPIPSSSLPATSAADTAIKPGTQPQDSTPASPSTTIVQPQAQPVPVQPAGPTTENKTTPPTGSVQPGSTIPTASTTAPAKDLKNEPEPPAVTPPVEDQAGDRVTGASLDTSDETAAPKHTRPVAPHAPAVVDGFTRKDIPDLLRKADAAAGSGDYKSALYEYDIVLRLDRANARARDGVRRAREAEKERR
ncbi:MAG TPA: protein kinase, partial [Alphaproteobacteria bacterium]|nr:protein kinase [Alphaproteobacteria bacterium]